MDKRSTSQSIFSWIWSYNARMIIVPLLVVELALVAAYMLSNSLSTQANMGAVQELAADEVQRVAQSQAILIKHQLHAVEQAAAVYRGQTERAYLTPFTPSEDETSRYAMRGEAWTTTRDNGGAALYYSGITPIGEAEREKAWQLSQLDPLMKELTRSNPLITQLYLNTRDSMNRIYPYPDSELYEQYPAKMDIPSYNFYYEADAKHNPERGTVWTDVYVDPAGQGWMTSCIAPVYPDPEGPLEGVIGLDVTVAAILQHVLALELPWRGYATLISRSGTFLALPEEGEHDWGLKEFTEHDYATAIQQDTFKPDAFNIYKRPELRDNAARIQAESSGLTEVMLDDADGSHLLAWDTIPETGWKLLVIVPRDDVYATAEEVGATFYRFGFAMLLGLFLFYVLFLALLYRRAQIHSKRISDPLVSIGQMVKSIEEEHYDQTPETFEIRELTATSHQLAHMARRLGDNRRDLVQLRDQALESSRLKSEFMANISHELRTPMSGVVSVSSLLLDTPLDNDQRQLVQTLQESGDSMMKLIGELLDFARIESGRLTLEPVEFDTNTWLRPIADIFAAQAQKRSLHFSATNDLPQRVRGDKERLKQVLINLLTNAFKFTERGEVSVSLQTLRLDERHVWLRGEVRDSGVGIPQEMLDRVFMPFTQADNSKTRNYTGLGLGLSICTQIIDAMEGKIGVESDVGVGSCFWFEVPLERVAQKPLALTSAPQEPKPAEVGVEEAGDPPSTTAADEEAANCVLVIEDNELNQKVIQRILKDYRLQLAQTGEEALELLQTERFDIILTDLHMPGIDGMETTRRIREFDQETPIIMLTADADKELPESFSEIGVSDHVLKPYRVAQIHQVVERWLKTPPAPR